LTNTSILSIVACFGVAALGACGSDAKNPPVSGAAGAGTAGANATSNGSAGVAGAVPQSGAAGTPSAGAPPSAGSSGASGSSAAGGSNDTAGAPSAAGNGSAGVSANAGAPSTTMDTPAWREMTADTKGFRQTQFSARDADPTVSDPKSHPDDMQRAAVNTSKPLKKKLCVVLTGIGTGPGQGIGDWAGQQGYHVFQIGYSNAISMAADGDKNPDTPGNTRMNQFDGKGRTPSNAQTLRQDSIEQRTIEAIKYLEVKDPGGDWGWFLNQDGSMRWSDGCFIGYSYGASHLAVIARNVRIGLGVSTSGPQSEGHPDASWIKQPSATPLERLFAIYGSEDGPANPGHYNDTTLALGYLGDVVMTTTTPTPGTPPFMGSHRIEVTGQGHTEFCAGNPPAYCQYMFGLPPFSPIP
jgi:hypothetical protein